ncbi:MAG: hypothetical protein MR964_02590 [Campylobacter sp.]|uniref:hypothetical protein n=1 Tax=Campylobacter sp. TaxID=205 RepID=UPI002AA91073|nr:hypothetical protein [Campylobacter sp.]MCI7023110.1 hypothetical protein [Campylobacter sp.]
MNCLKIILLFVVILGFGGCVSTTQTGRSQVMLMNESEELRIGEQARDEILKKQTSATTQLCLPCYIEWAKKSHSLPISQSLNGSFIS